MTPTRVGDSVLSGWVPIEQLLPLALTAFRMPKAYSNYCVCQRVSATLQSLVQT